MKYWKDKIVMSLRDMENGWFTIPKGTKFEITDKYKGFSLKGLEICQHCKIGRKISIARVEPIALMICGNK